MSKSGGMRSAILSLSHRTLTDGVIVPPNNRTTDPWMALEAHLNSLRQELGADAYELVDQDKLLLLPWAKNVHFIEEFRRAADILESRLGTDFVRETGNRRFVHEDSDLRFVAEPLVPGSLLIVVFTNRFRRDAPDLERASTALDKSRPALEQLLQHLHPEGDGGGPPAAAQHLPHPPADESAALEPLAIKR